MPKYITTVILTGLELTTSQLRGSIFSHPSEICNSKHQYPEDLVQLMILPGPGPIALLDYINTLVACVYYSILMIVNLKIYAAMTMKLFTLATTLQEHFIELSVFYCIELSARLSACCLTKHHRNISHFTTKIFAYNNYAVCLWSKSIVWKYYAWYFDILCCTNSLGHTLTLQPSKQYFMHTGRAINLPQASLDSFLT